MHNINFDPKEVVLKSADAAINITVASDWATQLQTHFLNNLKLFFRIKFNDFMCDK